MQRPVNAHTCTPVTSSCSLRIRFCESRLSSAGALAIVRHTRSRPSPRISCSPCTLAVSVPELLLSSVGSCSTKRRSRWLAGPSSVCRVVVVAAGLTAGRRGVRQ
jgi:hypothetical protein